MRTCVRLFLTASWILSVATLSGCGGDEQGSTGGAASSGSSSSTGSVDGSSTPADFPEARDRSLSEIRADEGRHDDDYWGPEVRSESYREAFTQLWDALHSSRDRWTVLAGFASGELVRGDLGPAEPFGGRLVRYAIEPGSGPLAPSELDAWIAEVRKRFTLDYFEFQPRGFVDADPARSILVVTLGLTPRTDSAEQRQIQVEAEVEVTWSDEQDEFLNYQAGTIRVLGGEVYEWTDPPAFEEALAYEIPGPQIIPPLCVYDVDGDGWTDVLYPQTNLLFRNRKGLEFDQVDFASFPLRNYYDALFGDFDGDGVRDFLAAGIGEGDTGARPSLYLFTSDADGAFTQPPVTVYAGTFESQLSFAAGDIDGDGDLDLYVGKYLPPFVSGQVPTPFHDSNDGIPGDLLINAGSGQFTQGIEGSGLEEFRRRRTFRVSFVDLDEDGDLDLLQTNDFAGTAIFRNDGEGHFELLPEGSTAGPGVDEGANFGMSHAFGDYDGDGETDFYVTGMYSHTVRRLDALGLGRPDRPDVDEHRMALAYGNRMYMGDGSGRFLQPPFRDSAANTGWSWGVTSFDLENDGDVDLFVANGHLSGGSIRDYDSRYWRHDVYHVGSNTDAVKSAYFLDKMGSLGRSVSWAGYEHNRLLLNGGDGFHSVGLALGIGDEIDSRHVVSEDFDRDGRSDLLVGFKSSLAGKKGFRIYRNLWPDPGNWISVTLQDGVGTSVFGTKIEVETPGRKYVQLVVAGDSFFSQHSNRRLFGLGSEDSVTRVKVTWPGGRTVVVESPPVGRDLVVSP